jgi:outer membrane protein OmpA-like peptidoglycan-associated protein
MDEFFASTLAMPEYTLNFNINETTLTAEENTKKLTSLIQWLNINPSANIDVSATWHDGEKKSAGNERYEAILKTLADAGISPARIIGTNNKKFQVKQVNANTDDEKTAARNITFSIVKK